MPRWLGRSRSPVRRPMPTASRTTCSSTERGRPRLHGPRSGRTRPRSRAARSRTWDPGILQRRLHHPPDRPPERQRNGDDRHAHGRPRERRARRRALLHPRPVRSGRRLGPRCRRPQRRGAPVARPVQHPLVRAVAGALPVVQLARDRHGRPVRHGLELQPHPVPDLRVRPGQRSSSGTGPMAAACRSARSPACGPPSPATTRPCRCRGSEYTITTKDQTKLVFESTGNGPTQAHREPLRQGAQPRLEHQQRDRHRRLGPGHQPRHRRRQQPDHERDRFGRPGVVLRLHRDRRLTSVTDPAVQGHDPGLHERPADERHPDPDQGRRRHRFDRLDGRLHLGQGDRGDDPVAASTASTFTYDAGTTTVWDPARDEPERRSAIPRPTPTTSSAA